MQLLKQLVILFQNVKTTHVILAEMFVYKTIHQILIFAMACQFDNKLLFKISHIEVI